MLAAGNGAEGLPRQHSTAADSSRNSTPRSYQVPAACSHPCAHTAALPGSAFFGKPGRCLQDRKPVEQLLHERELEVRYLRSENIKQEEQLEQLTNSLAELLGKKAVVDHDSLAQSQACTAVHLPVMCLRTPPGLLME